MPTSIATAVREYLASSFAFKPFCPLTVDELYEEVAEDHFSRPAIRAALYKYTLNTPVSRRSLPTQIHAVKISLNRTNFFLRLPEIKVSRLRDDKNKLKVIKTARSHWINRHGQEIVKLWLDSAQYRSVDIAQTAMKDAKRRDGSKCVLCALEGTVNNARVSACHLLTRQVSFWHAATKVQNQNLDILSREGTAMMIELLNKDPYHSDARYIITLCDEHNRLLLKTFYQGLQPANVKAAQMTLLDSVTDEFQI